MNLSEVAARVEMMERLVEELMRHTGTFPKVLDDVSLGADTQQQRWMAEWWNSKFSDPIEPNLQAAIRLEERRPEVFPD